MGPGNSFFKEYSKWLILSFLVALYQFGGSATAQTAPVIKGEKYVPTICVNPDGCEHWVFDDGLEGYMSPRLDRSGKPVCSGPDLANAAIGDFKGGSSLFDPAG